MPLDEKLGTPYYIAPEVLNKCYDTKCDIWACGVILYTLLSGLPPFNGVSDQDIMKKVREGAYTFDDRVWAGVSDEAKDFITLLLTYDRFERPSAGEAVTHPWITKYATMKLDEGAAVNALDNMTAFKADATMKQATFAFISSQLLSKEERENLSKVFNAFDKDGDGKLSI